jgi:hypothetical protein
MIVAAVRHIARDRARVVARPVNSAQSTRDPAEPWCGMTDPTRAYTIDLTHLNPRGFRDEVGWSR